MKRKMYFAAGLLAAVSMVAAQTPTDTPEAHVEAARAAAGDQYTNLFNFVCPAPAAPRGAGAAGGGAPGGGGGRGGGAGAGAPRGAGGGGQRANPPREQWHAEPVKVF